MIRPDHTVEIDDWSCFAQQVSVDPPFPQDEYELVQIDEGDPVELWSGRTLRKITFTTKLECETLDDVSSNLEILRKMHNTEVTFNSIYIGKFNARVKCPFDVEDGTLATFIVKFEVREVSA